MMRPRPLVRSTKPLGSKLETGCPLRKSGRITHKNGHSLASRPSASSFSCSAPKLAKLPKDTKRTEEGSAASSHVRHSLSSAHREMVSRTLAFLVGLNMSNKGPMGYTGIFWLIAFRDSSSSSCTVLKIIPDVLVGRTSITLRMKDGSIVVDCGRSAAWIGGSPGMKSIICCGSNDSTKTQKENEKVRSKLQTFQIMVFQSHQNFKKKKSKGGRSGMIKSIICCGFNIDKKKKRR